MAWCHQATIHYLNQCWPRCLTLYELTLLAQVPQYSRRTRLISQLLMPLLLVLAGHQQPWCWKYRREIWHLSMVTSFGTKGHMDRWTTDKQTNGQTHGGMTQQRYPTVHYWRWPTVTMEPLKKKRSSIWQLCHHWWHCKLPLSQLTVPLMMTKLTNWQYFFSVTGLTRNNHGSPLIDLPLVCIYASANRVNVGSDIGMSPNRHQIII